jgi:hypothetical protein
MRLHRSERLQAQWYTLPAAVRAFVEGLKSNPRPSDAMTVPERPGYYEEFIADHWIGWTVDESTGETIIRVTISESL